MPVFRNLGIAAAFWALGLLLAFHPTLLTGFARQQGAPVDTRVNHYTLEQEYRWLASSGREDLWSPGFFYPVPNAAAFGDVQVGIVPIYAIWRALGAPPDAAFPLWTMAVLSLNFAAFWWFLRRVVGASALAAGLGSFLFAFGASRVNQVGHEQLFSQFYTVTALYALYQIFGEDAEGLQRVPRATWIALFFAAIAAQLYTGLYMGWFFLFTLLVAGVWAAAVPAWRKRLLGVLTAHWRAIAIAAAASVVATAPLWSHYLAAASLVGFWKWSRVEPMVPRLQSWIYLGPFSRLYRWQYGVGIFRSLVQDQEHRIGIGLATTVIAGLGLYWRRKDPGTRMILVVAATVVVCVTSFPLVGSLWRVVFAAVPGANAIRAVARIGILMLIPAGIGVAYFVDAMRARRWLVALAVVATLAEQAQTTPSYDPGVVRRDVEALAAAIDKDCPAFLFTPIAGPGAGRSGFEQGKHQIDAMWAALSTGVPTINGIYSTYPPGWGFRALTLHDEADERRMGELLAEWCRRHDVDPQRVCWIRPAVDWSWTDGTTLRSAIWRRWRGD